MMYILFDALWEDQFPGLFINGEHDHVTCIVDRQPGAQQRPDGAWDNNINQSAKQVRTAERSSSWP